jgi:hypothetical protein
MKSLHIALILMVIIMAGCTKNTVNNVSIASVVSEPTATPLVETSDNVNKDNSAVQDGLDDVAKIEVDKGIFNVNITLPASMFKDQNIDEVITKAKEGGVGEVIKNADGSLTYKMSKAKHKEMLKTMETDLIKSIDELKTKGDYASIKDIEHNKSFSEFTLSVDKEKYQGSFDGFAVIILGITGMYYQLFSGASMEDYKVTVFVSNVDTGEVFDTIVYPDALEKMGQ